MRPSWFHVARASPLLTGADDLKAVAVREEIFRQAQGAEHRRDRNEDSPSSVSEVAYISPALVEFFLTLGRNAKPQVLAPTP
jgi:hypothetical protein